MWGLLVFVTLGVAASGAMAQPADCPARPAPGPSLPLAIDLAGRPGVPSGVTGQAFIAVPMQAPQTGCGEQRAPSDVLGGEPGDLLRGTPARTAR
ncbi:MAG TPA: hypothetical protein VND19_21975 [Acetobacteraceae bacterium]|nr:hypothetical protein [Acetobacteraceae bacterium]